jgi:hypothetical protein
MTSHDALDGSPELKPKHEPQTELNLYRRGAFGRKHFFSQEGSEVAKYFIFNPVPQKHASQWTPRFFRGDNPKYDDDARVVSRARRAAMWNSFLIELGDGVHEVRTNEQRVSAKNSYRRLTKWRKFWHAKQKPPKKPLEDVEDVKGLVMPLKMTRAAFVGRTLKWELGGVKYKWTGTRQFLPKSVENWKGVSHDLKVTHLKTNF